MRRLGFSLFVFAIGMVAAVAPAAADTTPGGTSFFSNATVCSTSGRQVCTDWFLNVASNEDGSIGEPCLEVIKYTPSGKKSSIISDEFGCGSGPLTIAADLSVTLPPTDIPLETCNRNGCTVSRTVTVSADSSPTGPISISSTRSTTKSGGCTTRTTTDESSAELAGTMTVDGTTADSTGFVDVQIVVETIHCK
jgi:hypothetical protein